MLQPTKNEWIWVNGLLVFAEVDVPCAMDPNRAE